MSYGSAAFGSSALGGAAASQQYFFFHSEELDPGTYRRSAQFMGTADFYEVVMVGLPFEPPRRIIRIYSHNDPSETPQLQVTCGEAFYSQAIVGAAAFIVVELEILAEVSPISIDVMGREYFQ